MWTLLPFWFRLLPFWLLCSTFVYRGMEESRGVRIWFLLSCCCRSLYRDRVIAWFLHISRYKYNINALGTDSFAWFSVWSRYTHNSLVLKFTLRVTLPPFSSWWTSPLKHIPYPSTFMITNGIGGWHHEAYQHTHVAYIFDFVSFTFYAWTFI